MTKVLTIAYKTARYHRERIFAVLFASILFVAFTYVFLLQKAILNVVQREKISSQTAQVGTVIGGLEEKYFSLKNTVTLDMAHAKGLKDPGVVSYISKKSLTAMATRNDI